MDSLFDILSHKDYDLPSDVTAIKNYVRDEFQAEVEVLSRENELIICSRSAALVGSLRLRGPALKKIAETKKRLVFRVA